MVLALGLVPAIHQSVVAQERPTLPNGATSLLESYQDWVVACATADAAVRCSMGQEQSQQDGQRVLGIELSKQEDGSIGGLMVLPFGLALEDGGRLQVDEQQAQPRLPFRTCLPVGCIAQLVLSAEQIAKMRAGTQLRVHVRQESASEATTLSISLAGFGTALDRTLVLSE
ncbi:invasion associated locus B family protein [Devosia sp. UYZn731]|uniref:invasion associated locus B family protein n=1 Tax=Devosia sp. UYZn731 TaxID=3156345 RepID=UPI00339A2E32